MTTDTTATADTIRYGEGLEQAIKRFAATKFEKVGEVKVVRGNSKPRVAGASYYWTDLNGVVVRNPKTYGPWLKYHRVTTRHVEVGAGWLSRGVGAVVADLATRSPDGLGGLRGTVNGVRTVAAARIGRGLWRAAYHGKTGVVIGYIQRTVDGYVHAQTLDEAQRLRRPGGCLPGVSPPQNA